jgi:hypothetical protein
MDETITDRLKTHSTLCNLTIKNSSIPKELLKKLLNDLLQYNSILNVSFSNKGEEAELIQKETEFNKRNLELLDFEHRFISIYNSGKEFLKTIIDDIEWILSRIKAHKPKQEVIDAISNLKDRVQNEIDKPLPDLSVIRKKIFANWLFANYIMEKIIKILDTASSTPSPPVLNRAKAANLRVCTSYIEKTFEFSPPIFAEKFIRIQEALLFFKEHLNLFKDDSDFALVTLRNFYKFAIYFYYYKNNESKESNLSHFNLQDPIWVEAKKTLTAAANLDSIKAIRADLKNFNKGINPIKKKKKKSIFKSSHSDKTMLDEKTLNEKFSEVLNFNNLLLEVFNLCANLQYKPELTGFGKKPIKLQEKAIILTTNANLDEDWHFTEDNKETEVFLNELDKHHENKIYLNEEGKPSKDRAERKKTTKLENLFDDEANASVFLKR